jgi:hypothetical protein
VDGQSSIGAGPRVDPDQVGPVDLDIRLVPRADLGKHAGPCTRQGPARAEHPGQVEDQVSAPRVRVLAHVRALARPGLVQVAQAA